MAGARSERIAGLFAAAHGLDPADRAAYLDRQCGGDDALRSEVLDLLGQDERAGRARFLTATTRPETPPRGGPAAPPRPPRLYNIDLFQGSGPTQAIDLREFLHSRLRRAVAILLVAFAAFFGFDHVGGTFAEAANGRIFYTHLLVILTMACGLGALYLPRRPGIATLRSLELVVVCTLAAFFAHFEWNQFSVERWRACLAAFPQTDVLSLTDDSCVLRWFALQVGYGFYLPNTWRRCALVVVGIGACPLATLALVGLGEGTLDQFGDCFVEMGLWMLIGGLTAIYGSYKLTQVRSRAAEDRQLGPYTLLRPLGSGGMGEVHLARHALLSRPCAVKLIRSQEEGGRDAVLRFEREAQATARLVHPNTVRIFDFGIERDGTFYLTMEYLPGLNLHDLVRAHGPLPPGRVVHLLRQACGALGEAHGLGLIHRDIKPGNLIVGPLGGIPDFVKLLDFGLVQAATPGPSRGPARASIAGTPGFLSPEQAAGVAEIDARSDLYSVGAVAHFLLMGRSPPGGRVAFEGTPGVEVPADLARVIRCCLEDDPGGRFADSRQLEAALAACSCAGDWGESEAARWWHDHPSSGPDPEAAGGA